MAPVLSGRDSPRLARADSEPVGNVNQAHPVLGAKPSNETHVAIGQPCAPVPFALEHARIEARCVSLAASKTFWFFVRPVVLAARQALWMLPRKVLVALLLSGREELSHRPRAVRDHVCRILFGCPPLEILQSVVRRVSIREMSANHAGRARPHESLEHKAMNQARDRPSIHRQDHEWAAVLHELWFQDNRESGCSSNPAPYPTPIADVIARSAYDLAPHLSRHAHSLVLLPPRATAQSKAGTR